MYRIFLVDTPIGPYFEQYLAELVDGEDAGAGSLMDMGEAVQKKLTKQDLEMMKQHLKRAWLEDFYGFIEGIGVTTAEVMGHILKKEADFRTIMVTLNSLHTPLTSDENQVKNRNALFPSFGYLYPEGVDKL